MPPNPSSPGGGHATRRPKRTRHSSGFASIGRTVSQAVHTVQAQPVVSHAVHVSHRSSGGHRKRYTRRHPLFHAEGKKYYRKAYKHNKRYAKKGPYQTKLPAQVESAFRDWVARNRVPFNPDAKRVDYDMRGYYKQTKGRQWGGGNAHFPDTYKTPYDTTFSGESRYAKHDAPFVWRGDVLVNARTGEVVFADVAPKQYLVRAGRAPRKGR